MCAQSEQEPNLDKTTIRPPPIWQIWVPAAHSGELHSHRGMWVCARLELLGAHRGRPSLGGQGYDSSENPRKSGEVGKEKKLGLSREALRDQSTTFQRLRSRLKGLWGLAH